MNRIATSKRVDVESIAFFVQYVRSTFDSSTMVRRGFAGHMYKKQKKNSRLPVGRSTALHLYLQLRAIKFPSQASEAGQRRTA